MVATTRCRRGLIRGGAARREVDRSPRARRAAVQPPPSARWHPHVVGSARRGRNPNDRRPTGDDTRANSPRHCLPLSPRSGGRSHRRACARNRSQGERRRGTRRALPRPPRYRPCANRVAACRRGCGVSPRDLVAAAADTRGLPDAADPNTDLRVRRPDRLSRHGLGGHQIGLSSTTAATIAPTDGNSTGTFGVRNPWRSRVGPSFVSRPKTRQAASSHACQRPGSVERALSVRISRKVRAECTLGERNPSAISQAAARSA